MADTIRSLFVKLAYDVDTTGADRFNSSFDRLTGTLSKVSRNYGKTIDGMKDKNRLFVITAGDVANAIGKIAGAGKKVFLAFADIQQVRVTLGFRTSTEEADRLIESVAKITEATGGYVTQLDALNAISFGGNITDQMGFFEKNLAGIIKLSKVAGVDFKETSNAIAQFIATGQGLDRLVEFEVISAKEKEALVLSGTAGVIGKQGIEARTAQAQVFLEAGAPKVDIAFEEFRKTGGAVLDQLATTVENTQIAIGSVLNPAVVGLAGTLNEAAGDLGKDFKKIGRFLVSGDQEEILTPSGAEALENIKGFFDFFKIGGKKEITGPGSQSTTVNQTNTVTVNAGNADAEEVGRIVESKLSQQASRINQSQAGKTIPKAVNAHVQAAQ